MGVRPHRDFEEASILLQDADPDSVAVQIPVGGPEGKPFYVSGLYDNVLKIMARLRNRLGLDGFTYLIHLDSEHGISPENFAQGDWGVDDGKDIVLTDDDL